MTKKRRKEGSVLRIPLGNGRIGVGRLFPHGQVQVYKLSFDDTHQITKADIVGAERLFIVAVGKGCLKTFDVVDFEPISEEEFNSMPPIFWQSNDRYTNCKLCYYQDNREVDVTPEECIGYECAGVFDDLGLIMRTNDMLNGVKFYYGFLSNLVRNTDGNDHHKFYKPENYYNSYGISHLDR